MLAEINVPSAEIAEFGRSQRFSLLKPVMGQNIATHALPSAKKSF